MILDENKNLNEFKFNLSFYYISTIVYLVVFIIVSIVSGNFGGNNFTLALSAIILFTGIIACYSLISLFYNIYKNKYLVLEDSGITIKSRFGKKTIEINKIISIKYLKSKLIKNNYGIFVIRILNKKRRFIIRPNDYQNSENLIKNLLQVKNKIENK